MKPFAEAADVLGCELAFAVEHHGDDAGCPKNIDEVFCFRSFALISSLRTSSGLDDFRE